MKAQGVRWSRRRCHSTALPAHAFLDFCFWEADLWALLQVLRRCSYLRLLLVLLGNIFGLLQICLEEDYAPSCFSWHISSRLLYHTIIIINSRINNSKCSKISTILLEVALLFMWRCKIRFIPMNADTGLGEFHALETAPAKGCR